MKIKTPQNSSKSIENNFEIPKDLNIIAAFILLKHAVLQYLKLHNKVVKKKYQLTLTVQK